MMSIDQSWIVVSMSVDIRTAIPAWIESSRPPKRTLTIHRRTRPLNTNATVDIRVYGVSVRSAAY